MDANNNSFADWIVLDLETGNAPDEGVEKALANWKPPANFKDPEKIEAKRQEAADAIREKAALLDASPVLCVAVVTPETRIVFNGMDTATDHIPGWRVVLADGERGMLIALRTWLDASTCPDTVLAGHNVRGFDLPKLRHAYLRHRLRLPGILQPAYGDAAGVTVIDTMHLFKSFSMEHRDAYGVSLATVAESLGLTCHKEMLNGAAVPKLHAAGEFLPILQYCALDTLLTANVFQLLTGLALAD